MKATLLELRLYNFQGLTESFTMNPGRNVFAGQNGAGKTRLANAAMWCLDGKDYQGREKFAIKSIVNGEQQEKGDHAVFEKWLVDDKEYQLGRLFREKWTKKRGELEETRSGNVVLYYIDCMGPEAGKDVKAGDYQARIDQIFGPNFKRCTQLGFVSAMHWKDRRDLLTSFAPVDQNIVIDSVSGFRESLGDKTPEQKKEFADKRQSDLKKKFADNKAAMAERQKDIDKAGSIDVKAVQKQIDDIQAEIKSTREKIDSLKQGDSRDLVKQLNELNQKLMKSRSEFNAQKQQAQSEWEKRKYDANALRQHLGQLKLDLADHNEALEKLRDEFKSIKSKTPESIDKNCSRCKQPVPADILQSEIDNFNRNRSADLKANNERGKEMAAEVKRIEAEISEYQEKIAAIDVAEPRIIAFKTNQEILDIETEIKSIQNVIGTGNNAEIEKLKQDIVELEKRLEAAQEQKTSVRAVADAKARMEELSAERDKLTAENDRINTFLDKYEEFIKAYADATQDPVNELFKTARFRMFDVSEQGKKVPACGVFNQEWRPRDTALSTGEQMDVDLDIISVFQKKLDCFGPVWIDGTQDLTLPITVKSQTFELLTMEYINVKTGAMIPKQAYDLLDEKSQADYSQLETLTKVI